MEAVIPGALSLERPLAGSVITAGTFDGVHRGHQTLVEKARFRAQKANLPLVAYTFDPHPASLFAPTPPKMLMPLDRRISALRSVGVDRVVVEPFNRQFSQLAAEDWVLKYVHKQLNPSCLVVGFDFTYGKSRAGRVDTLREVGRRLGFDVEVVQPIKVEGVVVSSSEIRRCVQGGRVEDAARLLGRPHAIVGVVEPGEQRGRTIGFPTANVAPEHEQMAADGVYAGWLEILDGANAGKRWRAVTNIGVRPTFDGTRPTIETHILDARLELYGVRVAVELWKRLRGERAFKGPEALRAQIEVDVALAREELGSS